MPADYTIDAGRRVVFSRGTGIFTHADYRGHVVALGKEPLFQPTFHQLVDCRSIAVMKLTADEIKDMATKSLFDPSSKRAFVASNSIQFGLSRMFASYREIHGKQEVRVFTEMREALIWLNLPEDCDPYAKTETTAT